MRTSNDSPMVRTLSGNWVRPVPFRSSRVGPGGELMVAQRQSSGPSMADDARKAHRAPKAGKKADRKADKAAGKAKEVSASWRGDGEAESIPFQAIAIASLQQRFARALQSCGVVALTCCVPFHSRRICVDATRRPSSTRARMWPTACDC